MAREKQRQRTRKDLLQAAARLMAEGPEPTLEEIAEAALVSRATAYRYFPGLDALLVEAALDMAAPVPQVLLDEGAPTDLAGRLAFVDDAFDAMIRHHEAPLRSMLVHALQRRLRGEEELPVRQNRRMPLIEAAIGDAGEKLAPAAADRLAKAMALVVGTEAMIVCKDVLGIDDDEARAVRRWAIDALAAAALRG
jgi:AcrR family transcriptional regulator